MEDSLIEWIQRNPRMVYVMGMPLLLILGHIFCSNNSVRIVCGIIAASLMLAITILIIITSQWSSLIFPAIGFIAWAMISSIKRTVG
jgi:hypothetical protein